LKVEHKKKQRHKPTVEGGADYAHQQVPRDICGGAAHCLLLVVVDLKACCWDGLRWDGEWMWWLHCRGGGWMRRRRNLMRRGGAA
jgi:hypothetical protein